MKIIEFFKMLETVGVTRIFIDSDMYDDLYVKKISIPELIYMNNSEHGDGLSYKGITEIYPNRNRN